MSNDLLTPDELKNELRKLTGQAYLQGMPAETILDELNTARQRVESQAVVEEEFDS